MEKPLRVGILVDSLKLKAWQHLTLSRIRDEDSAEIVLIIQNDGKPSSGSKTFPFLLYRIYSRLDRMLFPPILDPFAEIPFEPGNIPVLKVRPDRTLHTDTFPQDVIDSIRTWNLDVLIRFGFRILKGEILRVARFGIWSYHHGDTRTFRGGPPGFWEVMENYPVTGCTLQRLDEHLDGGTVLRESFSITHPTSVCRNRANYYWKSALLAPRQLKELRERSSSVPDTGETNPVVYDRPLYSNPQNLRMLNQLVRHAARITRRAISKAVFAEQWLLLYRFQPDLKISFRQFRKIVPPRDRFWADPFPVFKDGKYFVFFEEYLYARKTGRIAVMEIAKNGERSEPTVALEKPYHLSYPFVFEVNGEHYMIPETSKNDVIELYKCVEFPNRWEFVRNLIENIKAKDASILFHENRWWLFANVTEHEGVSPFDELFLFYSSDLLSGQWESHRLNPIVSDCRNARPAGRLFFHNGKLYRPSQNCSWHYGYGINLNEITVLNEHEYAEKTVQSIEPNWDRRIRRVHTLNVANDLILADAAIQRPRL